MQMRKELFTDRKMIQLSSIASQASNSLFQQKYLNNYRRQRYDGYLNVAVFEIIATVIIASCCCFIENFAKMISFLLGKFSFEYQRACDFGVFHEFWNRIQWVSLKSFL